MKLILSLLAAGMFLAGLSCGPNRRASAGPPDSLYVYREASRDGIGKIYRGREIAQVMGHLGAAWLERPEREQEERTDRLLAALALKPAEVVADIGAGTGYFTFRMAASVPRGRVLAVDIQPEMVAYLNETKRRLGAANVEAVLGTITNPSLAPGSVDLALLVDAYHEFSHPYEMMRHVVKALRPGGRVVLVEYRAEDPNVPIKPLHKLSVRQAQTELQAVGLRLQKVDTTLPQQHIMVFRAEP